MSVGRLPAAKIYGKISYGSRQRRGGPGPSEGGPTDRHTNEGKNMLLEGATKTTARRRESDNDGRSPACTIEKKENGERDESICTSVCPELDSRFVN